MDVCDYFSANAGRTIAVDGYVWLHTFAAIEAVEYECKQNNTGVLRKFKARAAQHVDKSVTPIFVFDGLSWKAKADTDADRANTQTRSRHGSQTILYW
jgi:hypothetical protein